MGDEKTFHGNKKTSQQSRLVILKIFVLLEEDAKMDEKPKKTMQMLDTVFKQEIQNSLLIAIMAITNLQVKSRVNHIKSFH